jgi:hypothetical protein
MARKYRMHGLAGIKEDAMEVGAVGVGAVAGIFVAKSVGGYLGDMDWAKKPGADGKPPAWAPYAIAAVPVAVAVGIVYAADKYALKGAARSVAVGAAAGMVATAIGNVIIAASPDFAATLKLQGLGASVDTYDSGLLAGLGEFDASVARYMMAGSPTQVQRLMGAPVQVQALAGAPVQVQALAGAPMSATLM